MMSWGHLMNLRLSQRAVPCADYAKVLMYKGDVDNSAGYGTGVFMGVSKISPPVVSKLVDLLP